MRHQYGITYELQKLWQHHFDRVCVHDHAVINTGKLLNMKRNRYLWIDKGRESLCNLSILYLHCPNLYNTVGNRRKSRCLDIEYNVFFIQRLSFAFRYDFFQVIYQIAFHAIDDLKSIIFIQRMICIRERLYASMVCDGNSLVSPLLGTFDDILYICDTIHIAHLGMAVQLHTFLDTVIHSDCSKIRNLLQANHSSNC